MAQKNDFNFDNSNITNNSINNIDFSTTNNFYSTKSNQSNNATYNTEPVWRGPVTMATLSWLSVPSSMFAIFSLVGMIIQPFYKTDLGFIFLILFILSVCIIISLFRLIGIVRRQIRIPLPVKNYALNGFSGQLMLEKIIPNSCPQCGGEMHYYKKLVNYDEIIYSNGSTRKINKKFVPVLECSRNPQHLYNIDVAEDAISEEK
ncbi:hypothetical protein ACSF85_00795 [Moraxella bovoculi]|uniref:hypothetical protein n=1 Tax=Moraxella bovoculi TaxID=386891 RepID=UPI003F4FC8EA